MGAEKEFPLVEIEEAESTKERILLASVKLFSQRGYAAVSVRDIADSVNVKPASLYNHFENKEALFDAIVDTIKEVYLEYYDRSNKRVAAATNFQQVIDALFAELKEVYHMFIFYGVSLISTEQFRNEKARTAFNDVYMKIGIDYTTDVLNQCVEKKWVKPFNTRAMATIFMNSVFAGSIIRAQEDLGNRMVYDPTEMFAQLEQMMLDSVEVLV